MATNVYKPVHETKETTNNDKVTGTIRGSYLMYANEHTKAFINNIEKTRSIYTKTKVIIRGKLSLLDNYNLPLVIN